MGFWETLTGGSASETSNSAARNQNRKEKRAFQWYNNQGQQYANQMQNLAGQYQPYQQAGNKSLGMLMNGIGLGGPNGAAQFARAYQSTPGYQEGLESGTEAVLGSANTRGMLNSGAAMKELQRFGSDYENQKSGDYLNRLMGVTGMGQQATGQAVGTAAQGLTGQLGAQGQMYQGRMQNAGTIGQGMVAGAQAEQQGLTNLMGMGTYLAGTALGGGMFPGFSFGKK